MDTESEASSREEEEEEEGVWTAQLPLSLFSLFQQTVTHNYSLISMVINHSEVVGRRAANLNRKVTWAHSNSSNSCGHTVTHTLIQVCVCVWIYEALYPSINGSVIHVICPQPNICFPNTADCHSKVNKCWDKGQDCCFCEILVSIVHIVIYPYVQVHQHQSIKSINRQAG